MNGYDQQALHAIKCYHAKHDKYPPFIEATPERIEAMGYYYFELPDPADAGVVITVPVVEVGAGDIVFRGLLVRNTNINLEQAKCATAEQFQRLGAKLARAGCLILEPKESWGLQTYNPHLFFSQIEAWAFGGQAAFDEVLADRLREEQE